MTIHPGVTATAPRDPAVRQLLDGIVSKAGATVPEAIAALQASGAAPGVSTGYVTAAITPVATDLQNLVDVLSGKPGAGLSDVASAVVTFSSPTAGGGQSALQVQSAIAPTSTKLQGLMDALAGRPNATVNSTAAAVAALPTATAAGLQSLIDAIAKKPNASLADVTAALGQGVDLAAVTASITAVADSVAAQQARIDSLVSGLAASNVALSALANRVGALETTQISGPDTAAVQAIVALAVAGKADQAALDQTNGDLDYVYTTINASVAEVLERVDALEAGGSGGGDPAALQTLITNAVAGKADRTEVTAVGTRVTALETAFAASNTSSISSAFDQFKQEILEFAEDADSRFGTLGVAISDVATDVANNYALKSDLNSFGGDVEAAVGGALAAVASQAASIDAAIVAVGDLQDSRIPALEEQLAELTTYSIGTFATQTALTAAVTPVSTALAGKADRTDLAAYAKATDASQVITAKSLVVEAIRVGSGILTYFDDEYGNRLRLFESSATTSADAGIVVVHTDLADLFPAKSP